MWCNGLDLEEWENVCSKEKTNYLHGQCDDWVLENYQDGDIAIIWNEFNEELGKVCLVHCYLIRGGKYVDVRGETDSINDIEEGFDYWADNAKYECNSLGEFKAMIRKICHYRSKKWQ